MYTYDIYIYFLFVYVYTYVDPIFGYFGLNRSAWLCSLGAGSSGGGGGTVPRVTRRAWYGRRLNNYQYHFDACLVSDGIALFGIKNENLGSC